MRLKLNLCFLRFNDKNCLSKLKLLIKSNVKLNFSFIQILVSFSSLLISFLSWYNWSRIKRYFQGCLFIYVGEAGPNGPLEGSMYMLCLLLK